MVVEVDAVRHVRDASGVEHALRRIVVEVEPRIARWPQALGMSFDWLSISVPDAAGIGSNTAAYMTYSHARSLAVAARISRDRLLAASSARTEDNCEKYILGSLRA